MAEVVRFRTPMGDEITVKLVDLGARGVTYEPVSSNAKNVHHHTFSDRDGNWNILIRNQNNQNMAAYVLDKRNGSWNQRQLTSAEERER